ncbi:AAA family ATPase [Dactylosporangium sp. CA-092794]|uniref:helix-turn-helix transcriptional regulator n=1 Tax=Dactylosporangium sp. CA-092794 TaxID=3239929 RepID=UPI003D8FB129
MNLIERDQQLAELDRLGAQARAGRGQIVLVTGPVGCGRTALLQAAAERLAAGGMLPLHASCVEGERLLPGGVVSQLWHGITMSREDGERFIELLGTLAARGAEPAASATVDAELLRVLHTLCLWLHQLAAARPLVLLIDDIGDADHVSVALLRYLIRRSRYSRILIVLTDPQDSGPGHPALLAELHRQPHVHRMSVAPLGSAGTAAFVADRLGSADPATGADYHGATGGNPLLLSALAGARPDTEAYGRAVVTCLSRAGSAGREVIGALAVLGDHAGTVALPSMVDTDAAVVTRTVQSFEAAGLLADGVFRHAAARAAVLADLPPTMRADLHLTAANQLHEAGAPATAVAAQLLAADRPAPAWSAPVLVAAAEHELAADRGDEAVAYLQAALRAQPDPRRAAAIRARLCQAEWELNPISAARHLGSCVSDLVQDRLDRRDGVDLVRHLLWDGRTGEAGTALDVIRARERRPDSSVTPESRHLEVWLSATFPALARRHPAGGGPSGPPPAQPVVAAQLDPWLPSAATLSDLLSRGRGRDGVEQAHQVLRDLQLGRHTGWAHEATLAAFGTLLQADQVEAAAVWSQRLTPPRPDARPTLWSAVLGAARAEVALHRGELAEAAEHATAALTVIPPRSWGVAVGLPLASAALAEARLGRPDAAAARLAQPVPEAMFSSRYGPLYLFARGQLHLATRHHHAALADFLSCGEQIRGWGLDTAGMVPWRAGAAEAWLRLGDRDQARRLISGQLSRPGRDSGRSRGTALRLLALTGPAAQRLPMLLESLELLEECGDRYEQAQTLAALANAYHALDDDRRARMIFRRSLYLARLCGAEPLQRELLSLGDVLGDSPAPDGMTSALSTLTTSERRVAALAAIGYTNREIASKLYVTASTVEQHLTRVYRKLNVKHRRDLPLDLTRRAIRMSAV